MLALATHLEAEDPRALYDRGDFAAAERGWREALEEQPTNWVAHHNLALALAQQERWGEAAAHATAAFVQQPQHPSVRWHYSFTLGRAGFTPHTLGRFVAPTGLDRLATLRSPAGWQRVLLVGVAALATAALLLLLCRYRLLPAWAMAFALLLAVGGAGAGTAALLSLPRYGPAAEADAVLIWRQVTLRSLPTDAPADQQTSTLAPGSLAVVDHSFLGWRRLRFGNGQTGWVRREEFVPLWHAR